MITYLVPYQQEADRYSPLNIKSLLYPCEYNRSIKNIYNIRLFLKKNKRQKIILNGNRLIDLGLIRFASTIGRDVNIIQHGTHLYAQNTKTLPAKIKKIFSNYRYLIMLFNFVQLSLLCFFGKSKSIKIKIFYFTDEFSRFFENAFLGKNYKIILIKIKRPDVLSWGNLELIKTTNYFKNFYVDEPLHETLSLSMHSDIEEIFRHIDIDEVLHVKIHPRTARKKYEDVKRVCVTNSIPKSVTNLFGFKSNLLNYNFKYENFYRFNKKGKLKLDELNNKTSYNLGNKDLDVHELTYEDLV